MTDKQFGQCMLQMQKGDKNGLRTIYEAYRGYIYMLIQYIVKDHEVAQDLTTEFFLRIWKIADQFKMGSGHKTWISVIARNMVIDWMRKKKQEENYQETYSLKQEQLRSPSAEQEAITAISFKEMIDKLPETEQQILIMKMEMDMTFKEISIILGIPIGTVTWKYRQSIEQLRRMKI